MNYVLETLNFHLGIEREHNEIAMEQMRRESAFVTATMESMIILTEAVTPTTTKQKVGNIFIRIKEFLKKIYNVFVQKVKTLVQGNKGWLEENKPVLEKINYDGLQLEIVPFWNVDMKSVINEVKSHIDKLLVTSIVNNMSKDLKDIDKIKERFFKKYLDDEGELTNGAKNYFRSGKSTNAGARPVTLGGDDLKRRIIEDFHPYCTSYATSTQAELNVMVLSASNKLDVVARALGNKPEPTKESYFIENDLIHATNLIVLEAEQPAGTTAKPEGNNGGEKSATNNNANDEKVSATKVTLHNNTDNKTSDLKNNVENMSADDNLILKNIAQCIQVLAAAAMTVAEERYTAYMNAMKQVVSARKSTAKASKQSNTEGEKPKNI